MFQYCKITHLEFFSFKCGLDIFFKNVASENCSHLSESRAGQNAGFLSAKKAPKSHHAEEKGKENKKKAKRNEGEKRNSPCLGFFVFCCCFCFVFFLFVCLFVSLPILWRRFSPQLANNDSHFFGGKVRLEFLKFGL